MYALCVCVFGCTPTDRNKGRSPHTQQPHQHTQTPNPDQLTKSPNTYLRSWRSLANRLALISPYKVINPQNTQIIPNQKALKPPHTPTKSHYYATNVRREFPSDTTMEATRGKSYTRFFFYKQHFYKQHKAEIGLFWNTDIEKKKIFGLWDHFKMTVFFVM